MEALVGFLAAAHRQRTRSFRARSTHTRGIAARGTAEITAGAEIPANAFFKHGKRLDAVVRFANAEWEDDASLDLRGIGVRLGSGAHSLDFAMNTGARTAFWDTRSLIRHTIAHVRGTAAAKERWLRNSEARDAQLSTLVRAPNSFAELTYHSQMVFRFVGIDGIERACRYRMKPIGVSGTHSLSEADRREPWNRKRLPEEMRSESYLREELRARIVRSAIEFSLEIQTRALPETREIDAFKASLLWDEERHPWREVARVELSRIIPDEEAEQLQFSVVNAPESLGIFQAGGPGDPNCLLWYRAVVYGRVQPARMSSTVRSLPQRISLLERSRVSSGT
ncbi:MAG: catalase [Steroidobacteraceae bacterium]